MSIESAAVTPEAVTEDTLSPMFPAVTCCNFPDKPMKPVYAVTDGSDWPRKSGGDVDTRTVQQYWRPNKLGPSLWDCDGDRNRMRFH